MKFRRLLIIASLVAAAFLLTTSAVSYSPEVNAQDTKTDSNTTGYPTGAKCPKTGTYKATNGKIEIILMVEAGKAFPPHSDGSKTIWYPVKDSN